MALLTRLVLVLALSVLPASAAGLTVDSAAVTFDKKKTDGFQFKASVPGLALSDAASVRLEFGNVSQTVPIDAFVKRGDKYTYKGGKNDIGLSSLVIDLRKGTVAGQGKNLILSGLRNPAPVRLVAGPFDECTLPAFKEQTRAWRFDKKKNAQFPCQIVDAPQANPSGLIVNTAAPVRIQARIFPSPLLDQNSVQVFRVDQDLMPVGGPVCQLLDNGVLGNGDDIALDSVFSCLVTLQETTPGEIRLMVRATLGNLPIVSPSFFLNVVKELTAEVAAETVARQQDAQNLWQDQRAKLGDTLKARIAAAKLIAALAGVKAAGVSIDNTTIWIAYNSGLNGGLLLNRPGTRGGRESEPPQAGPGVPPASFSRVEIGIPGRAGPRKGTAVLSGSSALLANVNTPVENDKVLIWDAYNSQFAPFDEGPALQALFQGAACPKFNVTYLIDGQATVNSVKAFTQYGTIILVTHGAVDGAGDVVFLTRENTTVGALLSHAIDLVLGRIIVMGDVFAIKPSFISSLSGGFENTVVYNGSCQSSANATMANAFTGKGAKTYYGFTRVVNSDFAQNVATQLFTNMVTNLMNSGESFTPVTPKVDPTSPFATFTQSGDTMLAYSGEFRNGDFETGDLTGWTSAGDGRVILSLAEFIPTEASFMGVISTGLGFTTDSGSIEQNFCLPVTATQLKFDWNFLSEEFREWCDRGFDDTFLVELITGTGATTLFNRSVDSLCGAVVPTAAAFDQSFPGCVPTGGNDCTVWGTEWQSETIDISAIASTNAGKGVTLRLRAFDKGDSIFDSAILLDKIEIVKP